MEITQQLAKDQQHPRAITYQLEDHLQVQVW